MVVDNRNRFHEFSGCLHWGDALRAVDERYLRVEK